MSDIFVSYSRADKTRIEGLVQSLEQAGYSVWWDHALRGGHDFAKDIEREIAAAGAVLVAWSKTSVESHWVRDEADSGRGQGKLVPVTLDGTLPPMGFRQMHTIDLSQDPPSDASMAALSAALADQIEGNRELAAPTPARTRRLRPARIAIPLLLLAAIVAGYFALAGSDAEPAPVAVEEEPASLAILPFTVLGNPDIAYIGQGLAANLANDLSAYPRLRIIAGTSANAMVEQSLTAKEIGERFQIATILEGDIREDNDRLTVQVRLVESASTRLLWSDEVVGSAGDLQGIERELLLSLASALQSRLGISGATPERRPDIDQTAYDFYLRGLDAINRRGFFDPRDTARRDGYRALSRSVELQPDYADAFAARAYLGMLGTNEQLGLRSEDERLRQVRADYERALELDGDNLLALSVKARWLVDTQGKIEEGIALLEDVLARSPDYHPALYHMAAAHIVGGDHRQALAWAERLVASDPINIAQLGVMMIATFRQYDYDSYRSTLADCELCASKTRFTAFALTGLASQAQCRADRDEAVAMIRADMPGEFATHYIATIDAICEGGNPPAETVDWLLDQHLPEIALASRFGAGERALDRALRYVETGANKGNLPLIMVDARISFPPELRADPRYLKLFDSEFGRSILKYRTKNSIPDGMPLKPDEVAAEKHRMAQLEFNAGPPPP